MDSLVPLGSFAPMLALDWRPQDFSICCYDAVIEALVDLRDVVALVAQQQTNVRPKSTGGLSPTLHLVITVILSDSSLLFNSSPT